MIKGMSVVITDEQRTRILDAVDGILRQGWLMWGPWQEQLSATFCEMTGKKHAVTFNSCTSAVQALSSYLVDKGHSIARVQGNVFPSVPMAMEGHRLNPYYMDIDPVRLCPSLSSLDASMSVLYVQWTGGYLSDEVKKIRDWCAEREIVFVEDCSHAAGSSFYGRASGSFGDHAVFSLAATKPLQTGQGGMLVTNDDDLAQFAFEVKNYGRDAMFHKGEYRRQGGNYHMTELQAAVGVILHEYMDEAIEYRYQLFEPLVTDLTDRLLGSWDEGLSPNLYKVIIDAGDQKEGLRRHMTEHGIEPGSGLYDFVTPTLEPLGGFESDMLPETQRFADSHVCLPMHNGMSMEDAEYVNKIVTEFLR